MKGTTAMKVKFSEWKIDDYLKTPEQRAFYLEAAIEEAVKENDMDFLAEALGDVARAIGGGNVAAFMAGISTGIKAMPTTATPKTAQRRASKRELARAAV